MHRLIRSLSVSVSYGQAGDTVTKTGILSTLSRPLGVRGAKLPLYKVAV